MMKAQRDEMQSEVKRLIRETEAAIQGQIAQLRRECAELTGEVALAENYVFSNSQSERIVF